MIQGRFFGVATIATGGTASTSHHKKTLTVSNGRLKMHRKRLSITAGFRNGGVHKEADY